jgi:hypothetical protein
MVAKALKADTAEAVENLQQLEGALLDALQQALWAKAMEGTFQRWPPSCGSSRPDVGSTG